MSTYVGKGYSSAFTANYDGIAKRLGRGETSLVVEGPDDICTPLLESETPHCHGARVRTRDDLAAHDVAHLLGRWIAPGVRIALTADLARRLREGFASERIRTGCAGCEWSDLCSAIAKGGFDDVRMVAERRGPVERNGECTGCEDVWDRDPIEDGSQAE